jgi:dipeptidyl aminopeptidase/acylaminoacyl peptidase
MKTRLLSRATRLLSPVFALVISSSVAAQNAPVTPKRWTVDDVLAMKTVSDVAISPDGKRVAYVVTARDREDNVNKSDIWVVPVDGGAPVQVTYGPRVDRAPQWVGDGSWLAFLSDRGEGRRMQVYGIDPTGGEAWPVTKHETAVSSFRMAPNGQRIAFLATAPAARADQDLERERGRPIVVDSAYAVEWTRLWSAPIANRAAGETRVGSPERLHVTALVWGPDSRAVAWTARPSPLQRASEQSAVYAQSEPGADARKIVDLPGGANVAGWPNELGLLVSASGKRMSTDNDRLWLVPITGEAPVSLTDSLDENAVFVAGNARELLVEAAVRTGRALYRIPLAGGRAAGPPQRLSDSTRFYTNFSAARSGGAVAFLAETATQPPDVHVTTGASFSPRRLTTVNPAAATFAYGDQRVISWRSRADSERIEGILSLPVDYQAGTRVPLLVVIHGGPAGVSSNRHASVRGAYPIPVFTSMGYAVLQPNYRGSTGYGQRFRGLNVGDIMGKDWIDVNSGVDAVIRMGMVDTTKMGIMGWSFGGFHTFWGITQTRRFSAASAGAGANDLTSFYSQTDISESLGMLLAAAPWENPDRYLERSAYRFAKNVTTPLLIQVGDADRRVPPAQSIQFYEAVKGIGKTPVKLVLYPGQPHGIEDPRLSRDLMQRNVAWFSYWIPVTGNKPPVRVAGTGMP